MIRRATINDLHDLIKLETACFATDRLSRANFWHLLTRGNAVILVYEPNAVRGYLALLFRKASKSARIYSLAVAPDYRRGGAARSLVQRAEQAARQNLCCSLRLEIRKDNHASMGLFKKLGYHAFGIHKDYYEDHMDALRFEKALPEHRNLRR